MDQESTERIEQEMKATRSALTEKVAALEGQVVETISDAASAVHETVQTVKSALEETVCNVTDTVKESVSTVKNSVANVSDSVKATLDVPEHVRNNPWTAVLGATACGFVTGYFLIPARGPRPSLSSAGNMNGLLSSQAPRATSQSSVWNELGDTVVRELKSLAEAALTKLGTSAREWMDQGIREFMHVSSTSQHSQHDSHSVRNGREFVEEL